ncbi:cellulose-binding protein [Streptomyces sp. J2-1]|uniref:cellulose-binding protein n=1 Tax=Streptomyces corallincola TaxID=2851888 RepID=UPI001C383D03|nr:cellulose-binding protein [Streptomyces corallincola]MBV2356781.1 cellulose-binding protein [Streptomyces corallincola]
MSSASSTQNGFPTVRGRAYRPAQVDAFTGTLSGERDAAWERAARLTVLVRDMEAEAARWRAAVEALVPHSYETLGEQARHLYRLAVQEASDARERALREGEERVARAEARAKDVRQEARDTARALRAEAEEYAVQVLAAARGEADALRIGARRAVREGRAAALTGLREVRERTGALFGGQNREQADRWAAFEREEAEREASFEAEYAERTARAELALADAERTLARAEQSARRCQDEAHTRATDLLTAARAHEQRLAHDTERVLRDHSETWDDVQTHMASARTRLTSLTGGAAHPE